ncbi:hypothetical protein PHYSODRAFT_474263 [Phytophthora sojae]|uniref:Uncharacterized protein n=1 Tax=Phytophthora sojae (strain P6497) TaxID=1094619 RepID=G4YF49_PHYSP|nr:hypothetical protein PHYSODRAFT_474263 [Phytophthora sojae]EGZ27632.1 hypothetical protein PHYSODRAFT_474263 [Phytophthora sojae]|eukprot:XP_009514907.1 hypothetical protein PHYSODRAFT_474263 [Phytophthora sojae]
MSDSTQLADSFLFDSTTSPDPVISVSKDKRVVNVVDDNNSSYQSGTVIINATSQLNGSTGYGSLRDAYVVVPYVVTVKNTSGAALNGTLNRFAVGLKAGVWNILDKLAVEINGKSVITSNDYKNYWNNLRAQTEWCDDDLLKNGADCYLAPDDVVSLNFPQSSSHPTASTQGDGFVNNSVNAATTVATGLIPETTPALNNGLIQRLIWNPQQIGTSDATGATITATNPLGWPTTRSGAILSKIQQQGTGGYLRLVDLHPIFKELDLVANPQIKLTMTFNTGFVDITTATGDLMSLSSLSLNGCSTVPVMVSSAAPGNPNAGKLTTGGAGSLRVAFGVMSNNITQISTSGQIFPFTTTRLYIPFYDIANQSQIVAKPVKKINYLDCYAQYFKSKAGTGQQNSQQNAPFSFQLSSSLKNIKYIALIPFSETSSGHFLSATNIEQFQSPFDSAPWTCQPGASIRNFQVMVGNENVFNKTHDYSFESFQDEVKKLGAINGALSHEISNGLFDSYKWDVGQRVLIADCSRLTNPDVPQSILVSGTNTSSQGMNCLILVVYGRSMSIDRLTGEVVEYE